MNGAILEAIVYWVLELQLRNLRKIYNNCVTTIVSQQLCNDSKSLKMTLIDNTV